MRCTILMGSPRKNGNTISLLTPFMQELSTCGVTCHLTWLYDKNIQPCIACRQCQKDWTKFGCHYCDSVQEIFDAIIASEIIILATPIYSWYCTPPMKALLDRLVYGMNKYYGERKGPSLWAGKQVALITTCGYPPKKGSDLFEQGMARYCKHSQLNFIGSLSEHDQGYQHAFMDEEKAHRARQFAHMVYNAVSNNLT